MYVETLVLALLLLAAVLASSVIYQVVPKVSSPLIQIGMGLLIAMFASSEIKITLDPDLFLVLFIAPLLYDGAKNADKPALWKNRAPVLSLAVGLVMVSTLIIGFAVNAVIPSIPLAAAFALGAALGPTDAVAVGSLSKDTDIPEQQKSILEGESLINDASGIVSFQFALAAVVTGTFSLLDASISFVVSFFGGFLFGGVLGFAGNIVIRRVRAIGLENTTFHVLFEVFTPFIIFLIANAFGASGIIAVVVAGLVNVISVRAIGPSISRLNIVSTSVWRVLTFALNGVVFVLLGTQLPNAMQRTWQDVEIGNLTLIGYILALSFLLLFIRFVWVLVMNRVHGRKNPNRGRLKKSDLLSALVMSLAGAKGTITLAVLFTIPVYISPDAGYAVAFPQRDLIIFLACGVIVVTLLLATFVVPLLVPKKKREKDETLREETECNIEILRRVIEELSARQTSENRRATRTVIKSYNDRIARIKDSHGIETEPNIELHLKALQWEHDFVNTLIDAEKLDPLVGYRYFSRIARIRKLLVHSPGRWSPQNFYLRLRTLTRVVFHGVVRGIPGLSISARSEAYRDVQVRAAEHVIDKLQEIVAESEVPTEDVSALILEYQRICTTLRSTNPSITAIAHDQTKVDDIRRIGLRLELELIQAAYEDERLCRASVKRLRENVYLMQVDLEDNV